MHIDFTHLKKGVLLGSDLKAASPDCPGNPGIVCLPFLEEITWTTGSRLHPRSGKMGRAWPMLREVEDALNRSGDLRSWGSVH